MSHCVQEGVMKIRKREVTGYLTKDRNKDNGLECDWRVDLDYD